MTEQNSMAKPQRIYRSQAGFTLVEMIVVMTITAILAAIVAVFIKRPVEGYFDSARRAEMTDAANTAVRRLERELHAALPNSVRVTTVAGVTYLEFLEVRTGGRYRNEVGSVEGGDPLDFAAADSTFDILGPTMTFNAGEQIVVFNLGVPGADAYEGNTADTHNRRAYSGATGAPVSNVTLTSANRLPFASPGNRFQVVTGPVTYVCAPGSTGVDGTGTLRRYWGYAIQAAQPSSAAAAPLSAASNALLAQNVSVCEILPPENLPQPGYALLAMRLTLLQESEPVSLYHEVHINNVP